MPRLDRAIQIQDMLQQLERESKVPVLHPKTYMVFNQILEQWRVDQPNVAYSPNMFEAKLYNEREARELTRDPLTNEIIVPLENFRSEIEKLYHTLNPGEYLPNTSSK